MNQKSIEIVLGVALVAVLTLLGITSLRNNSMSLNLERNKDSVAVYRYVIDMKSKDMRRLESEKMALTKFIDSLQMERKRVDTVYITKRVAVYRMTPVQIDSSLALRYPRPDSITADTLTSHPTWRMKAIAMDLVQLDFLTEENGLLKAEITAGSDLMLRTSEQLAIQAEQISLKDKIIEYQSEESKDLRKAVKMERRKRIVTTVLTAAGAVALLVLL